MIRNFPLPEANWILVGGFNMVEQISDKQGGNQSTRRGQAECTAWNDLTIHLELYDAYLSQKMCITTTKQFTWKNRRRNTGMICSRLDRFYVNTYLRNIGGQTGIWPSMPYISDHAPAFLKLYRRGIRTTRKTTFNRRMLHSKDENQLLLTSWKKAILENQNRPWQIKITKALKAVKMCSDTYTSQIKKDAQDKFQAQYEEVIETEIDLQGDRGNNKARDRLDAAQMELHLTRQNKMEAKYDKILSSWTRTGDQCNKEFFKYHTGFQKPNPIKELYDGSKVIREQVDI